MVVMVPLYIDNQYSFFPDGSDCLIGSTTSFRIVRIVLLVISTTSFRIVRIVLFSGSHAPAWETENKGMWEPETYEDIYES
ncbi:MAG TPA: hypothetical protein ENI48_02020 [Thioploca sp.]|nr:hypothetical protein [Thioploca sp.]